MLTRENEIDNLLHLRTSLLNLPIQKLPRINGANNESSINNLSDVNKRASCNCLCPSGDRTLFGKETKRKKSV